MDISVSHLNNRLALQLPQELPLGLVFVMGKVQNVVQLPVNDNGRNHQAFQVWFDLIEEGFQLRCALSQRASSEIVLSEGDEIRAGGHLAFDSQRALYYLLARDVETVGELASELEVEAETPELAATAVVDDELEEAATGRRALTPVLADIKRRAESTKLSEANVPYWVQRLAPPELQAEAAGGKSSVSGVGGQGKSMDDKLVAFLNMAIDSEEEIELTPDMVATLSPKVVTEEPTVTSASTSAYEVPPASSVDEVVKRLDEDEAEVVAKPDEEADRLIISLIVLFIILIVVILAALGVYLLM